ncbi:hypothetical protein SAMN05216232_0341 [Virgibacillus subterraneus]|uniref:WYL domain-containing protein n=1 Tax=Virgibacillus subterraneus TaxID=621109 RepID=A0A1H8Z9Z6_9BACI|nr:hypothetical protein [Virgibacillus subterraneus]SEP61077.1 hypothetical protein SAMN05216232_0341 [Virgibacillus subterraneus]
MNGLIQHSVDTKEKIVIFYMDHKNNVTERYIRVINYNDDKILAYCYYRKQVRTFKRNNILSVGPARKQMEA